METDPERVTEVRGWTVRALGDLAAGAHDLEATRPFVGDALFHAQQAAEKAMKAFLAWHDVPFRKTHDLAELGQQCMRTDPSLEPICARVERLTVFAWVFRYPTDASEPPVDEAREALALARDLYDAILSRLPADVRP